MKLLKLACLATLAALTPALQAQLLITEINSNNSGADFWELTNFGPNSISLSGYSWDDDGNLPDTSTFNVAIASGQSIVFLGGSTDITTFRANWNLAPGVVVIADNGSNGLGQNDAINLFNSQDVRVATLSYGVSGFLRLNGSVSSGGHAGISAGGAANQSLIWDPTSGTTAGTARYTFANGTNHESFAGPGGAAGSPGFALPVAVPEPGSAALVAMALAGALTTFRRRKG